MGNFKNLPSDIILDIITRLPTESILDCKLVCRPWRILVSHHPSFSRLHLARLINSADSGNLSVLGKDYDNQLHYFECNENHDEALTHSIRRLSSTPPFQRPYYNFIGSFNGLVCLYGLLDRAYCICNPVTREYVMLPSNITRDMDIDQGFHCSCGFGYLPSTNEYKVVEFYRLREDNKFMEVSVYSLGSGKGWRNVGRLFDSEYGEIANDGVFVNGALYWVDDCGESVVVFDVTKEEFVKPVSPPLLPPDRIRCGYSIGVLGGVLYYCLEYYGDTRTCIFFDVWLLKEKNDSPDQEPLGWKKEFTLPVREPLAFTKSGGVLYLDCDSLGIYNPVASTLRYLVDSIRLYEVVSYKKTLISMKELTEEDIKIMEAAEIEEAEAVTCRQSSYQDEIL